MNSSCFFCETKGDTHLSGCPDGLYLQASNKLFKGKPDLVVFFTALSKDAKCLDTDHAQAVREFERGYDDGWKIEKYRRPSDHPSYSLGLNRSLAEQCVELD
ncbi:MAG: hypothetical protein G01um101418_523 [Parcubacteria group bacterium Gr01-1014_18]|nr:MAG: hypothetical protein Greene041636_569 [Parcubacteria group bacterium Greene0416_36]TSC80986.1 MAG: hypothetical protein G01um101418_523 [Parcubacteria group bacterium Gr01-1014_18]TSC98873.1 MAG: hypothetical protein Greene101420_506 [Parcubacteria group bacterium Greene1014_20]TSD06541.1 MAG: hypothetical protein Greene07142_816 [Parcubacteria group bacterium Greene0714_2]